MIFWWLRLYRIIKVNYNKGYYYLKELDRSRLDSIISGVYLKCYALYAVKDRPEEKPIFKSIRRPLVI